MGCCHTQPSLPQRLRDHALQAHDEIRQLTPCCCADCSDNLLLRDNTVEHYHSADGLQECTLQFRLWGRYNSPKTVRIVHAWTNGLGRSRGSLMVDVDGERTNLRLGQRSMPQVDYTEILCSAVWPSLSEVGYEFVFAMATSRLLSWMPMMQRRARKLHSNFFSKLGDLTFEVPFGSCSKRFSLGVQYGYRDTYHLWPPNIFRILELNITCDGQSLPPYTDGAVWPLVRIDSFPQQTASFWYDTVVDNTHGKQPVDCTPTVQQQRTITRELCDSVTSAHTVGSNVSTTVSLGPTKHIGGAKFSVGLTVTDMKQVLSSDKQSTAQSASVGTSFKTEVKPGECGTFRVSWDVHTTPFTDPAEPSFTPCQFTALPQEQPAAAATTAWASWCFALIAVCLPVILTRYWWLVDWRWP